MTDPIPYEEIDPEIRRLVRLMNAAPGICSLFSCAGHNGELEGYVLFSADDYERLFNFINRLPLGAAFCNGSISIGGWVDMQFIWVQVESYEEDLRFRLYWRGNSDGAKNRSLERIEAALKLPPRGEHRISSERHSEMRQVQRRLKTSMKEALEQQLSEVRAAKQKHRKSGLCEFPHTCGGCHFWSGAIAALCKALGLPAEIN